jgi:hypothetical protein
MLLFEMRFKPPVVARRPTHLPIASPGKAAGWVKLSPQYKPVRASLVAGKVRLLLSGIVLEPGLKRGSLQDGK